MNTIFIGIAGGTGSGKTTLTEHLKQHFGDDISVVHHDSYYKHQDLPFEERCKQNYDHPDAFETDLMVKQLKELKSGKAIHCPVYSYADHQRTEETELILPSKVVIVEGILIFQDPTLREMLDIKIFVETDADVRILRRALRDVRDRGRTLESVITQVPHDSQAHARAVCRAKPQVCRHHRARGRAQLSRARHDHAAHCQPHCLGRLTQKREQPKAAPFFEILLHAREAEHHADHGGNADENDWVQVFGLFDAAREEEQRQRKDDAAPVDRTVP